MPDPNQEHKGIKCMNPDCGAVDNYSSGQMKKLHEHLIRPKTCKTCGTVFTTVEAPVKIVTIKNNHLAETQ